MITLNSFKAPWWLSNAHAQTLWSTLFRKKPAVNTRHERLELPDGDFLDLFFTPNEQGPIVLILHGLQGSVDSKHVRGMLKVLQSNGYRAVLMQFRGSSGVLNRLPRMYHSGETGDALYVIKLLNKRYPDTPIAVIGYSLGGNVLLKLLGELEHNTLLQTAIAISVPMKLAVSADKLNSGFSKVYQRHFIRSLVKLTLRKLQYMELPGIDADTTKRCKTFWEFDNEVTAKLHGFKDVHDYYSRASSHPYLQKIQTPTLILQSKDDPFTAEAALPQADELSAAVTLELSQKGGHVGFISGHYPWRLQYWLEQRIVDHLNTSLRADSVRSR